MFWLEHYLEHHEEPIASYPFRLAHAAMKVEPVVALRHE
jgi:hypothetical protein